jgi:uncharacterized protein YjiS (DUF1127 family)
MTSLSIAHTSADISRPSLISNLVKRLKRSHADRRTIAELSNLDDRLLDDIGLTRSCIRDSVMAGSHR